MEVILEKETKDKKKKMSSWLILVILILILGIIMLIHFFLFNGNTTTTGSFEGEKDLETLTCESDSVDYPIFEHEETESRNLKINAVYEDDNIQSIALYYKLGYPDIESAKQSESFNHADMNLNFYDKGMEADSLNAKYSFVDNSLQMSIYAKKDEMNQNSLRYFMLDNIYNIEKLTKEKVMKTYSNAGFNCVINNTNKEVNEK